MANSKVSWPRILSALGREQVRSIAVFGYRITGFSPDDFTSGIRAARESMADALTRTEDWLEINHPVWRERESIRGVRRELELELWP